MEYLKGLTLGKMYVMCRALCKQHLEPNCSKMKKLYPLPLLQHHPQWYKIQQKQLPTASKQWNFT